MKIQQTLNFFSIAALISLALGCSSSQQIAKSSSKTEIYDDMYASANETRPASLASRELYQQIQEEEYMNQNPEYRGQAKNQTQGTDEYYSQNWINSRQYYQNQTPYGNGYNNYGYNNGLNSPFNRYGSGFNSWYGNPGISFGLGYGSGFGNSWNRWGGGYDSFGYSPFGFGGGYSSFGFGGYSPFNGYGYGGYSPYGYGNSFYDPYNSFYGRGYGNVYVYNYGNNITGANGNYSNPVTPRTPRARDTYSSSAYNSDYNRGGNTVTRGSRTENTNTTVNSDYYSRPRRDNGYSTGTTNNTNTNATNRSNSSWNWSNNNSNSNTNTNSSWGGNRSSTGSSNGSFGGSSGGSSSGGGGGSRGPR